MITTNLVNAEMSRLLNHAYRITKDADKVFELVALSPSDVKDEKLKKIVQQLCDLKYKYDVNHIEVSLKDELFRVSIITNKN